MNDDLKAYVDGELPPDAAERLRLALERDPVLRAEADALRALSTALRRMPEPEPVGQAATLAALSNRRPLWRVWTPALAGCAAVLIVALSIQQSRIPSWFPARYHRETLPAPVSVEATIPAARRESFVRFVRSLGGEVHPDGDGLRAFYPSAAHERLKARFLLPEDLAWPTDGLRVRLTR